MAKFNYGISSITLGAILPSGGMGTTLAAFGKTFEGTAKLTIAEPTITEFHSEESDTTEVSTYQPNDMTLELEIMDPDATAMASIFGGTTAGTPKVWTPPTSTTPQELSVKIIPKAGMTWAFPRVLIVPSMAGVFSKKNLVTVKIKGIVLQPTLVGAAPYTTTDPAS